MNQLEDDAFNPALPASKLVADRATEFLSEQLIPACLAWIEDLHTSSPPPAKMRTDIARLLDPLVNLCPLRIHVIDPQTPLGLAFGASAGAVGGILAASLYPVDLAYENAGVILGGCVGAASAVLLLIWITRRWRRFAVLRPRTPQQANDHRWRADASQMGPSALFNDQLGHWLCHSADVVLAWVWAQACGLEAVPRPAAPEARGRIPAPPAEEDSISVYEAIEQLAAALRREKVDLEDVRDIAREVVQRYQDEGFEWKIVEEGASYDETIQQLFNTFGHVELGQPVKTLQPALLRNGVLKKRGLLRRIRP